MRDTQQPRPRILLGIGLLAIAYLLGYGAARGAGLLIHIEWAACTYPTLTYSHSIEVPRSVRSITPTWLATWLAKPLEVLYLPLRRVEADLWEASYLEQLESHREDNPIDSLVHPDLDAAEE